MCETRISHINIISKDWKQLADFYMLVFNCEEIPPQRKLQGDWLEKLTKIEGVKIEGIHLKFPFHKNYSPSLEIFTYNNTLDNHVPAINQCGFSHLAIEVENVNQVVKRIVANGGSCLGDIVQKQYETLGCLSVCYCRDPEENI